jgi:hypothetical protein
MRFFFFLIDPHPLRGLLLGQTVPFPRGRRVAV